MDCHDAKAQLPDRVRGVTETGAILPTNAGIINKGISGRLVRRVVYNRKAEK